MVELPRDTLARWAASKPTIKALYVFGSYARGEAQEGSDLDLAFEFTDVDNADAELIDNAIVSKSELTRLTGIRVQDLHHHTAKPVTLGQRVCVFSRP